MSLYQEYITGVLDGSILVNNYVRSAIERHQNDLKRKDLFFDTVEADKAIAFVKKLRHTQGKLARKPFDLKPFQGFIIASLAGWKNKNGLRRFRKSYIEMARKGGKSELMAALLVLFLVLDNEQGGEFYSAATTRDQASIVFDRAKIMIKQLINEFPFAERRLKILKYSITYPDLEAKVEALSSDYDKLDGRNPHISIIDEYMAHKTSGLLEVIETGMGSREQPLLAVITTAGFNMDCPCYDLRKVCIDILKDIKQDDTVFSIIYTLDVKDDWNDSSLWIKANPNIGSAPYWDYMKAQHQMAINEGLSKEVQFKTKNLNIWTSSSISWISDEVWKASGKGEIIDCAGRMCFGGLDLASIQDWNCLSLFFPSEDSEPHVLKLFCWIPEETANRTKGDKENYLKWAADGHVTLTSGSAVDYRYIEKDILKLAKIYNFKYVNYDRWNASQLVIQLTDENLDMKPFGQGFRDMSVPTKELNKLVLEKKIEHEGNPIMRWMMSNVELEIDPAANIKISKKRSRAKVDGPVSAVMAIGAWKNWLIDKPNSVYEDRGIIII